MTRGEKHVSIRALLKPEKIWEESESCYNCLPPGIREKFQIIDLPHVSSHDYDPFALQLIDSCKDGWVLDVGAGFRKTSYQNVVNYEIERYPSTDVLGVAETMPFKDGVFDGVVCLAVLEHVKDPFRSAREIVRVLKPGGKLYCVVPFLQALHGYPHHYYNMTAQGLKNLFDESLVIDRQIMLKSGLPIWSLTWFLQSWLGGLSGEAKDTFAKLTVADLANDPMTHIDQPYVSGLSDDKNFELASTTALFATKPSAPQPDVRPDMWTFAKLHEEFIRTQERLSATERTVESLDRRLNAIRRSRWWRFRRRLIHFFGYEDRKD